MKRILTISWLLSALWASAVGQTFQLEYRPFAIEGKVWETQVGRILENLYGNYIDGDTLIDGKKWKKVYNYFAFPDLNSAYYAAISDEGQKVYAIAKGRSRPRLLYDFGLKEGNIVKCGIEGNAFGCLLETDEALDTLLGFPFRSYLKVERIDTIKARGLEYRRFFLTLLDAFKEHYRNGEESIINNVVWIEGIGSGAGPFLPWTPLPAYGKYFLSCELDRTCIFGYSDFYESENVDYVSDIQEAKSDAKSFDLSGRRLATPPTRRGVYVNGGRKVMIK